MHKGNERKPAVAYLSLECGWKGSLDRIVVERLRFALFGKHHLIRGHYRDSSGRRRCTGSGSRDDNDDRISCSDGESGWRESVRTRDRKTTTRVVSGDKTPIIIIIIIINVYTNDREKPETFRSSYRTLRACVRERESLSTSETDARRARCRDSTAVSRRT